MEMKMEGGLDIMKKMFGDHLAGGLPRKAGLKVERPSCRCWTE
jgi:hypothetical protein